MLALQRKLHSAPCVDDGRVKDRNGSILRLYNKAELGAAEDHAPGAAARQPVDNAAQPFARFGSDLAKAQLTKNYIVHGLDVLISGYEHLYPPIDQPLLKEVLLQGVFRPQKPDLPNEAVFDFARRGIRDMHKWNAGRRFKLRLIPGDEDVPADSS